MHALNPRSFGGNLVFNLYGDVGDGAKEALGLGGGAQSRVSYVRYTLVFHLHAWLGMTATAVSTLPSVPILSPPSPLLALWVALSCFGCLVQDVVHAKWLEQLRVVWQGDKKEEAEEEGNEQRSSPSSGKERKQQSSPSTDEKDKGKRKEDEDSKDKGEDGDTDTAEKKRSAGDSAPSEGEVGSGKDNDDLAETKEDKGVPSSTEQGGGGVPEEDVSSEEKKAGDDDIGGSGDKAVEDVTDPAAAEGALTAGRRAAGKVSPPLSPEPL